MWGASGEPPGATEADTSKGTTEATDTCEQNKSQLESLKEIMLQNKQSLKKKEEEVQEYARKLSKIKSRTKMSRRGKDAASSSVEATVKSDVETLEASALVDDISQATTPKAKSSLLQRKLAENRKIFERRSKEITESKRLVEEKVEAIRQQLDERDSTVVEASPVTPMMVAAPAVQLGHLQDKDNKIAELGNRVLELEATVVDLRENLREKDSVIDAKTKAITLMSADLSRRGKTTLDTLEDTKDEMRAMQANFVLLESSFRAKNDNLLEQLRERNDRIAELEEAVDGFERQHEKQRQAESALIDAKDAMKSMQENFVLVESSLKSKNDHLLRQLEERETRLAAAEDETASGADDELRHKLDRAERSNRQLLDDKYELQKEVARLQERILATESAVGNGLIVEKDNRIAELENLIEELRRSNQLLEEESKAELQKQLAELASRNEESSNRIGDLERIAHDLETERNKLAEQLPAEVDEGKEEKSRVARLTKELDESNKSMIKLKAQHRSKVKNLQRQLENFKKVSDANAELVKLGNQVALLEEEKGNLQLSLVDFDELKASTSDWQERIADLESKVSAQANEIESHVVAIATLENQKLDFIQELHTAKREISALEAENAECENLRVTAEMKVVELEEQLESLHKSAQRVNREIDATFESERDELRRRIDALTRENGELVVKLAKLEEKGTSDAGSTESFETLQEADRNELLRKVEVLTQHNNDLMLKLGKLEDRAGSIVGSTESFETINDADKSELLKKIDLLTQENNELLIKLNKMEEKGSSDTGSTGSFERIPEQTDASSRIDNLTRENNDLVIKLVKLEEKLALVEDGSSPVLPAEASSDLQRRVENLTRENSELAIELTKLKEKLERVVEARESGERSAELGTEKSDDASKSERYDRLAERVDALTRENAELATNLAKIETEYESSKIELERANIRNDELTSKIDQFTSDAFARERLELIEKLEKLNREKESVTQERLELHEEISTLLQKPAKDEASDAPKRDVTDSGIGEREAVTVASLESEIEARGRVIAEQSELLDDLRFKLAETEKKLESTGCDVEELRRESSSAIEEWRLRSLEMQRRVEALEEEKASIEEGLKALQAENQYLIEQSEVKDAKASESNDTIASLESRLRDEVKFAAAKDDEIAALKEALAEKGDELRDKCEQLQKEMIAIDTLQEELNASRIELQEREATMVSLGEEIQSLNASKAQLRENEAAIASLEEEIQSLHAASRVSDEELASARREIEQLRERLQQSRTPEEFAVLVEQLRDRESILISMQRKIDELMNENAGLYDQINSLTQHLKNVRTELNQKDEEMTKLATSKVQLEEQLREVVTAKSEVDARLLKLQETAQKDTRYAYELAEELNSAYKKLELLKAKHTADIEMQNRRLEDVLEESSHKSQENENLKAELEEEKRKLVELSEADAARAALEVKLEDCERRLVEAETVARQAQDAQLEKMKKIAANLKKRVAQCQDLEKKLAETEEKWTTEKLEKEMANNKIRELEVTLHDRDDKIAKLEEKLTRVEALANEVSASRDKVSSLLEQMTEMGEEIERLRAEVESKGSKIETQQLERQSVLAEYDAYKREVLANNEKQQYALDEVKESARELSVRMQVMEAEYVEQLGLIQKLKAENGLLSSGKTQINERLENVEKELEERTRAYEDSEREKARAIDEREVARAPASGVEEDATRTVASHHCDHCDQCQLLVQALEARLQERDAEIENLHNELANSIRNFVQMGEAVRYRLMNETSEQDRTQEELYDDLLLRYNALTTDNEGIKERLDRTAKENEELTEKIESLQGLNATLQERIRSVEGELSSGSETEATLRASRLESEVDECRQKITALESMIEAKAVVEPLAEPEKLQDSAVSSDGPQLFDAFKAFGIQPDAAESSSREEVAKLRHLLAEREAQLDRANRLSTEELMRRDAELVELRDVLARTERDFDERRRQVDLLNVELNNVGVQLQSQLESQLIACDESVAKKDAAIRELDARLEAATTTLERVMDELRERDATIEQLEGERNNFLTQLDDLKLEKLEAEKLLNRIISVAEERVNNIRETTEGEPPTSAVAGKGLDGVELKLTEILAELDALKRERDELRVTVKACESRIAELQRESAEGGVRIQELEERAGDMVRERDLLQLQVNDLTFSLERAKESTIEETKAVEVRRSDLASDAIAGEEEEEEEEEGWGWNADEAEQQHAPIVPLVPSVEIQLQVKVAELEDRIGDLEVEREKLSEESRAMQARSGKLTKKLKEYKARNDSLERQLASQKSVGGFCDLDSAIEEELKSQIGALERAASESREELKKLANEKENLLKRVDVLIAANERFAEMKERQDMDIEVLQIRNKELTNKMQGLEWKWQEVSQNVDAEDRPTIKVKVDSNASTDAEPSAGYKTELDDLRAELEALAAENDQLQQLLEEQRTARLTHESDLSIGNADHANEIREMSRRNEELLSNLDRAKEEYELLRKQYEQSLVDANDQVAVTRQNYDALGNELAMKTAELEKTRMLLSDANACNVVFDQLREQLQTVVRPDDSKSLEETSSSSSTVSVSVTEVIELLNARVQEVAELKQELQRQFADRMQVENGLRETIEELSREARSRQQETEHLQREIKELAGKHAEEMEKEARVLKEKLNQLESSIAEYESKIRCEAESRKEELAAKESTLARYEAELRDRSQEREMYASQVTELASLLESKKLEIDRLNAQLDNYERECEALKNQLKDETARVEELTAELRDGGSKELRKEFGKDEPVKAVDSFPVFRMEGGGGGGGGGGGDDDGGELRSAIENLKAELEAKKSEIEHLKYILDKNTYPKIIQQLQDNINDAYNEKESVERSMQAEIQDLRNELENTRGHQASAQRAVVVTGDREEIARLQNDAHEKEQEINELRYVITQKDSQLAFQASLSSQSDDFELQETIERLNGELRAARHEIEGLGEMIAEKEREIARLAKLESLSKEDKDTINRLASEKEQIRAEAEAKLGEKEAEIDAIKQRLSSEGQQFLDSIGQKDKDIENLLIQLQERDDDNAKLLRQRDEELSFARNDSAEKDRRLAELSITKDAEIHNLKVQIHERDVRIEELLALTGEEERQLEELRRILEAKEREINDMKARPVDEVEENETIQRTLSTNDQSRTSEEARDTEYGTAIAAATVNDADPTTSNELDLALYMLHQRDVRCEELTLELMQLLEERDTLQLRLSNAIRVNEELRRIKFSGLSAEDDPPPVASTDLPIVEQPSPSKVIGPVEIAKEAMDSTLGEDALAHKLSQLHRVDQSRDVTLRDDREMRHNQQMSLLAHKDVLKSLPPEAAARLVNANYTLSRDVQSQSSVLMNWLWGKSTPKVMHM